MTTLRLFNTPVRVIEGNMVCLTDIWLAASKAKVDGLAPSLQKRNMDKLRPWYFLRNSSTKRFIRSLIKLSKTESLDVPDSPTLTMAGNNGGTYAHKLIAYKYAAFLDSDFEAGAYIILDKFFTGELHHRNSLSAQLNMKCHEFDQKKDMASFCGQGLAAWRYTKPGLIAEINTLANQLQITIPGLPG
ncbi:KilA-N domain-containing protein [Salmonella enterica subsp. enterica serovar Kottbus]|nr:DNA-binding protein [Salmonella enterica subsp. enterica serovar Kottbus]ECB3489158.1 DNA-binding protein [Salmonella enterica subsp. enterica serovar Kottbus]EDL0060323.1 DNA-binding protein [Salmonella enterica subsp. enterica serovar Kottbus]EII1445227.1 KilA-N domain-containing protein [Salmonella enterica subsp. enterica serovar Kottbus]